MTEILHAIPHSQLKMQFDCYHLQRMYTEGKENAALLPLLAEHIKHIGHIQFAYYPGRQQPRTGNIDFVALFTQLQHLPYQGWCGAEYRPSKRTEDSLNWLQKWQF